MRKVDVSRSGAAHTCSLTLHTQETFRAASELVLGLPWQWVLLGTSGSEQTHLLANFQERLLVDVVITFAAILDDFIQFLVITFFSDFLRYFAKTILPAKRTVKS